MTDNRIRVPSAGTLINSGTSTEKHNSNPAFGSGGKTGEFKVILDYTSNRGQDYGKPVSINRYSGTTALPSEL